MRSLKMNNPCTVGASLLAKNFKSPRASRMPALSLTIFASKLAPTVEGVSVLEFLMRWHYRLFSLEGITLLAVQHFVGALDVDVFFPAGDGHGGDAVADQVG